MSALGISAPTSIVNVYGSADGGLLGIETPLSIEIRRKLRARPALAKEFLDDSSGVESALFQFDPGLCDFEEVGGELVLTADLDVPLVRYNIHDRGKVISYADMMSRIGHIDIQGVSGWQLPFLVVSGRTDVAIILHGAKIYPETLRFAIEDTRVRNSLSGSLLAYSRSSGFGQTLCLDFELSDGANIEDPLLAGRIASVVQERLLQSNSEYRNSCQKLGYAPNFPSVTLYRYSDPEFRNHNRVFTSRESTDRKVTTALFWPAGGKPTIVGGGGAV